MVLFTGIELSSVQLVCLNAIALWSSSCDISQAHTIALVGKAVSRVSIAAVNAERFFASADGLVSEIPNNILALIW